MAANTVKLLARVAELRAEGIRWEEAATRLNVAVEELRNAVDEDRREYERLARHARRDRHELAVDTMITALIELMHSPDAKIKSTAVNTMSRFALACMRHGDQKASARLAQERLRAPKESQNEKVSDLPELDVDKEVNAAKKPELGEDQDVNEDREANAAKKSELVEGQDVNAANAPAAGGSGVPAAAAPPEAVSPAAARECNAEHAANASESTEVATQAEVTAAEKNRQRCGVSMEPENGTDASHPCSEPVPFSSGPREVGIANPLLQTRMTRAEKRKLKQAKKREWARRKELNRKLAAATTAAEGQMTSFLPEG